MLKGFFVSKMAFNSELKFRLSFPQIWKLPVNDSLQNVRIFRRFQANLGRHLEQQLFIQRRLAEIGAHNVAVDSSRISEKLCHLFLWHELVKSRPKIVLRSGHRVLVSEFMLRRYEVGSVGREKLFPTGKLPSQIAVHIGQCTFATLRQIEKLERIGSQVENRVS